jgi:hypothetical protein
VNSIRSHGGEPLRQPGHSATRRRRIPEDAGEDDFLGCREQVDVRVVDGHGMVLQVDERCRRVVAKHRERRRRQSIVVLQ